VIKIFEPATLEERRKYYREEWDKSLLPNFILNSLEKREFGFDHHGKGPNDRYRSFRSSEILTRFLRYRNPFAVYTSVAFYEKPRRRDGWIKSELVFDVDAKDIPLRSCNCKNVCEICLEEAKQIVSNLITTLKYDLGLKNIHIVYSGRGYHIRISDESVMKMDSEVRSQILKYIIGAEVPQSSYGDYNLDHFTIPFGYFKVFTDRAKYLILNLNDNTKIENISPKFLKNIIENKNLIKKGEWGKFKLKIDPNSFKIGFRNYNKLMKSIAKLNMNLVDTKVTIDLRRILRLPSSLHSMVSMKCIEVKNIDRFDPFEDAVPKFVTERKNNN
jgi:DNA primase small subunit